MRTPLPFPKKGAEPPNFRPMFIVAKRLDGSRVLGMEVGLSPGDLVVLDGDPAPSPKGANFYCAQTAECITMPLGMEVALSLWDFVFDGDPAPSPKRGRSHLANFRPMYMLWPNGWMDQDGTWHGRGPRSRPHCARYGKPDPFCRKEVRASPILLSPNGWMNQDGTWHGGEPWSKPHCARWGPSSPPPKGDNAP